MSEAIDVILKKSTNKITLTLLEDGTYQLNIE